MILKSHNTYETFWFQFDFGDPLIVKDTVYGLFAGADDLVPGEYPMVYTDVTKYQKWINKYIGGWLWWKCYAE